jgi:hypothetical protein
VLLIHGWNVIEPRIDFGLGLRHANGRLRPPAGAHVSASDEFIHGPVAELFARLSVVGIIPTFGLRYPGGASQNLLQAFTQRHSGSELEALRRLAQFAGRGAIDALQLEMSVAVRLAGPIRARGLDAWPRFSGVCKIALIALPRATRSSPKRIQSLCIVMRRRPSRVRL